MLLFMWLLAASEVLKQVQRKLMAFTCPESSDHVDSDIISPVHAHTHTHMATTLCIDSTAAYLFGLSLVRPLPACGTVCRALSEAS